VYAFTEQNHVIRIHKKIQIQHVRCGITGKLLNIIRSMYGKIKSCVKLNGKCSDLFECSVGLMQLDSLSFTIKIEQYTQIHKLIT
jgi:hypothetical protein